jgi:hypothetical protein
MEHHMGRCAVLVLFFERVDTHHNQPEHHAFFKPEFRTKLAYTDYRLLRLSMMSSPAEKAAA